MYYVYILFSDTQSRFYIGYTKDIARRVQEHKGKSNHTTARYKSLRLLFYEAFVNGSDARRREKYFKTTKGKKALRLILRDTLDVQNKNLACPVV